MSHRQSLEMVRQGFSSFLITSCRHENYDLVSKKEFHQSVQGLQLLANIRHHVIKVTVIKLLAYNIESSLKLTFDVDLGEGRPLRVEFKPLADAFITKNVESLEITVLARLQRVYKTARELALWSV